MDRRQLSGAALVWPRATADKSIGRARAMRQSMLAMIDKGRPHEAHPAYGAPFVVVGEGGAAR
jgi:hypothetical protein